MTEKLPPRLPLSALTSMTITADNAVGILRRIARNVPDVRVAKAPYPTEQQEAVILNIYDMFPHNEQIVQSIYRIYRWQIMNAATDAFRSVLRQKRAPVEWLDNFEDAESSIYVEIPKALSRFNRELGLRLITFLRPSVFCGIRIWAKENGLTTARGTNRQYAINKLIKTYETTGVSFEDAVKKISKQFNEPEDVIRRTGLEQRNRHGMNAATSLNDTIGMDDAGGQTFQDMIADESIPDPVIMLTTQSQEKLLHQIIEKAMASRPARDQDIFRRNVFGEETLKDIGDDYGITRERARQIAKRSEDIITKKILKTMRKEDCILSV